MKKYALIAVCWAVAVFTGGCGYTFSSLGHPQINSVAIAPVTNETLTYNAASVLRNQLCERFMVDSHLKLTNKSKADCIVYARVTQVKMIDEDYESIARNDDDFIPSEWRMLVAVQYSVIIPGRAKPLISNRSVVGETTILNDPDLEIVKRNGLKQALNEAAKKIVAEFSENW